MDDMDEDEIPSFKIVLIGSSGVGKTSIINRYLKESFEDETLSTTGVCFNSKTLNFPDIKESCKIDVKYKIKYFLYIDLGYCWTRKI
jgi:GTPase SAR1 family protein